jgi:hypothetical protein
VICDLKVSCSKLNRSWLILIILLDGQTIRAKVTYRDNEIEIFYNGQNLGEFYYAFYVVFVVFLVFILWNALKMVRRVTETCRC